MVDERPRLAGSEIEAELLAELQKLPSLRDTQSVRVRPYSGSMGAGQDRAGSGTCEDQVCRRQGCRGRLQQQYDLDPGA
jgi:hypothetical protein